MSTKTGKRIKGKNRGHKNSDLENLSCRQLVRQVKIGGDG